MSDQLISDEPTRLAEIIEPLFADQAKGWSTRLTGGERADLLAGADAQDDCAVFHLEGAQELVLGSDYVRGSKFRLYELGYLGDYDIGYYLAMANFSDIAVMGAQPIALLSVIRYPRSMPDEAFTAVVNGIRAACNEVGAPNVGGDIGTAERLLAAWKRPRALVRHGRILSRSGVVTSCQDSSDGLKAGIQSIAALSDVGFVVDEAALPVHDLVAEVAALSGTDITGMILGDSVDFQLVFTVPPDGLPALRRDFNAHGLPFFEIGTATPEREVLLRRSDGTATGLPGVAWRHAT